MSIRTIDLDNKPIETPVERRLQVNSNYDKINSIGLVELGNKVQAMTDEEKRVVAANLPIDVMLDAIRKEFDRYSALEEKLNDMLKRFGK